MRYAGVPAAIFAIVVSGCAPETSLPLATSGLPQLRLAPFGAPIITPGFSTPESVTHDRAADVYLVSNVNGHPQLLTNDGFISRVAPDGTILELEWIAGGQNGVTLHAPTGIVLVGDVLYVADADAVRFFDRLSGAPLGAWPVSVLTEPVPGLPDVSWVREVVLNDICAGPRGEIYLTATGVEISLEFEIEPTGQDVIYRFQNGHPIAIASGPELAGANGCAVFGGNVYIAPLLSNEVYRINPSGRRFHVATLPVDGLDGIAEANGFLFVSSIFSGSIFRMSAGGAQVIAVMQDLVSPADLGFDARRQRLLVPSLFGDFLMIQPLE